MQVSVENTSTLGRRLKVSVPDATIKEQIFAKINKLSKEAHIKGFRPGKVPHKVIEQKFGQAVRNEVIQELIEQSLGKAISEQHLQLAGRPTVEKIENVAGKNLEFTATFDVYPEIVLNSLTEKDIEKRIVDITDADVKNMIDKLKDQLANWSSVDRNIQKEDKISVDFARLLKDQTEKQEQKNVEMIVGVSGVLPGLSEALIGKSKGEVVEIASRYPEDWAESSVGGKDVTLWVTIHDILEKQILSQDELIEKMQMDKSENLEAKIKERMIEEVNQALKEELKEKVLEKFLELNPIELPGSLIEQEKEAVIQEITRQRRGAPLSKEELQSSEIEDSAKRRVELGLLLNEVIKVNQLKVDGNLVRAEIERLASRFPNSDKIVELYYKNNDLLASIERMVLLEQAVDALLKEAKLVEKKATFDEVMNPED